MAAWTLQTVKKMRAVRAGGNTLLRVRYEEPVGNDPAACHVRAVLAAFLAYTEEKGQERCEKRAVFVPTYSVRVQTQPMTHCTAVHLLFGFDGEREPVTLTEYWCGDGAWQVQKPPDERRRRRLTPQNSTKFATIQKEISQKPLENQKEI